MVLPPWKNKILYFDQISKSSKKYAEKGRKNSNLAKSDSVFKHFLVFGWFKVKLFGPKAQNFITQGKYESFMTHLKLVIFEYLTAFAIFCHEIEHMGSSTAALKKF